MSEKRIEIINEKSITLQMDNGEVLTVHNDNGFQREIDEFGIAHIRPIKNSHNQVV